MKDKVKEYFEAFWKYYPHDMILAMEIIKKVWVNHALASPSRVPFKKSGELSEEYVLSKCVPDKNMFDDL